MFCLHRTDLKTRPFKRVVFLQGKRVSCGILKWWSCRIVELSISGSVEWWSCRIVEWWMECMVELLNRRVIKWWSGGFVESSNGGMILWYNSGIIESSNLRRRIVESWSGTIYERNYPVIVWCNGYNYTNHVFKTAKHFLIRNGVPGYNLNLYTWNHLFMPIIICIEWDFPYSFTVEVGLLIRFSPSFRTRTLRSWSTLMAAQLYQLIYSTALFAFKLIAPIIREHHEFF